MEIFGRKSVGYFQTCGKSIVTVDDCKIRIRHKARNCRCFCFNDIEVVRIFNDVILCRTDACIGFELNETDLLKKIQCSCFIGAVVGYKNLGAFGNIFKRSSFASVNAVRFIMDRSDCFKVRVMVLVEVLHIRSVLEVVGVEIAAFNVLVRENVIGVFLDFEGVTLCCEVFLYKVENLGVRSRRCTDFDGLVVGLGAACEAEESKHENKC